MEDNIKLSIIIPTHKESSDLTRKLFESLDSQIGIDWTEIEIIICNDTEEKFIPDLSHYKSILNSIKIVYPEVNNNLGMNRQAAIDIARGEYLMFCDADDCLYSCVTLNRCLYCVDTMNSKFKDYYDTQKTTKISQEEAIKKYGEGAYYTFNYFLTCGAFDLTNFNPEFDLFAFDIIEQNESDRYRLRCNQEINIWVYGKLFRRKFLEDNNIRFRKDIRYSEDVYFSTLTQFAGPKIIKGSIGFENMDGEFKRPSINPIYVQYPYENSITRNNKHEYTEKNDIIDHCDAIDKTYDESLRLGFATKEKISRDVSKMFLYYYAKYLAIYLNPNHELADEWKVLVKQRLLDFINKWDPYRILLKNGFDKKLLVQYIKNLPPLDGVDVPQKLSDVLNFYKK